MKSHQEPRHVTIPALLVLALPIALVLAAGPSRAEATTPLAPAAGEGPAGVSRKTAVRVYTNADLVALPPVPGANAARMGRLPGETSPTGIDMESWSFVLAIIDRERAYEEQCRQREMASAAAAAAAIASSEMEQPVDLYYVPYSYYPYTPVVDTTPSAPMPSNPYASLQARGIRTAEDLFRESVRDSRIRRLSQP